MQCSCDTGSDASHGRPRRARRAIIDANLYVTLGTADAEGVPWVSPVYFATPTMPSSTGCRRRMRTHSRNIAQRSQVSMVIFDSQVPTYHGRASTSPESRPSSAAVELDRGIEVYPGPATRGASTVAGPT